MLSFIRCPFCGKRNSPKEARHCSSQAVWRPNEGDNEQEFYRIALCSICRAPMLFRDGDPDPTAPEATRLICYPEPLQDPVSTHAPATIQADGNEALLCLRARAWRGAAVLARRAVQAVCVEKNAAGNTLMDQINDLGVNGFIPGNVLTLAHAARWLGNDAAHPGGPEVTEADARVAVEVMRLILGLYETEHVIATRVGQHRPSAD